MKLIVGLGNPGEKYEGTRHNTGFSVLDKMAEKLGARFKKKLKNAIVAEGIFEGEKLLLAKPQTFINLSGESVRPLLEYYRIPIDDLLIIVDDVNLEIGNVRIRPKGSAGGHNGLKNLIAQLGTEEFARVRVGVGSPKGDLANHVLSSVGKQEKQEMEQAVEKACETAFLWVTEDMATVMNKTNVKNKAEA